MSLSGYRRLLKSAAILFSKDEFALLNAKKELRSEFLKNKNVIDTQELGALLRGIEEVDEMIRFNVVQGSMNERGNFGVEFSEHHCVTIEANQGEPNGPELAIPDASLLGKPIKIEKSTNSKKL